MIYYNGTDEQRKLIKQGQAEAKVRCSIDPAKLEIALIRKLKVNVRHPWRPLKI